jgi:amino acid transporter
MAWCLCANIHDSMTAGEARGPHRTVPRAFKTIIRRLMIFFIGGCLRVGVSRPWFLAKYDTAKPTIQILVP